MKIAGPKTIAILVLTTAIAGCDTSQGVGRFITGDSAGQNGPDEFGIVPTKPLVLPEDFVTLPEPTPGARNLTDPLPEHDAVAALGGQPARLDSTQINAGEGALLAAAERRGTASNIREILAEEDAKFRKDNGPRLIQRLFKADTYLRAYEGQTLEARRANELLRRRGVKTPTVEPSSDR